MRRCDAIANYPHLDFENIKELIAQKNPHTDINSQITPYNGDKEWEERCKELWWGREYTGEQEEKCKPVLKLKEILLNIGGCETCLPAIEEDLENIIQYGQVWDNVTRKMMKARPSQCHSNSAELWYNNREKYKQGHAVIICTGYALSEDGMWRQHSWLVHAKPRANVIVETTVPRVAYFGFGLTYDMAEEFEAESF